jgi:Arc/MetJ-type ribon-helix-helix transcriptional regulator
MRQTNISLTEPQIKTLSELSEKTGLSKSEIIRRALDRFTQSETDWWNEISQAERDDIDEALSEGLY